jgi:hypothetical protein
MAAQMTRELPKKGSRRRLADNSTPSVVIPEIKTVKRRYPFLFGKELLQILTI